MEQKVKFHFLKIILIRKHSCNYKLHYQINKRFYIPTHKSHCLAYANTQQERCQMLNPVLMDAFLYTFRFRQISLVQLGPPFL